MLKIKANDSVSIVQVENTDGYDGHSLRAFAYFGNQMPEIQHKLSKKDMPGKFYEVNINGQKEYYHESDIPDEIKRNLGL